MVRGVARTGKGSKFIRFIPKGGQIAAEGSIADLISSSSDYGNMANLFNEYAPWLPFSEFLSVDPDKDNPWTARIKAIFAGAGLNIAGYTLVGFARGRYAAIKAKRAGYKICTSKSHERSRIAGKKKVNAFKDGLKIFFSMIKLFFRRKA